MAPNPQHNADATTLSAQPPGLSLRLWLEFLVLFFGFPIVLGLFFGRFPLFPVLGGLTMVALLLLAITPGFRLRGLLKGPVFQEWPIILGFTLITALTCVVITLWLVPERFMELPLNRTGLWIMIMVLYPVVSVIPQELIYRPLFFRRYGRLFPNVGWAVVTNGIAFGLAHLFFMNWVAIGMTTIGGLVMGWAYMRHQSFLLACVLHALAGQMIFTSGLGIFFYHGAIGAQ